MFVAYRTEQYIKFNHHIFATPCRAVINTINSKYDRITPSRICIVSKIITYRPVGKKNGTDLAS